MVSRLAQKKLFSFSGCKCAIKRPCTISPRALRLRIVLRRPPLPRPLALLLDASLASSLALALRPGRSTLAVAGVFGAGKTRSLTFLLAWLALTTHLKIAVVHKENPAGGAITKLLTTFELEPDHQRHFSVQLAGRKQRLIPPATARQSTGLSPSAECRREIGCSWSTLLEPHASN